jgi:phasin
MAKDPTMPFEMPQEMRKFVEQSVNQAQQAFESFMSAANSAVVGMDDRASMARSDVKDMTAKAMGYAQRNIAASFDHAQKLVRARDAEEVLRLQSEFVKAQIETLSQQAKELGEMAGKTAAARSSRA